MSGDQMAFRVVRLSLYSHISAPPSDRASGAPHRNPGRGQRYHHHPEGAHRDRDGVARDNETRSRRAPRNAIGTAASKPPATIPTASRNTIRITVARV